MESGEVNCELGTTGLGNGDWGVPAMVSSSARTALRREVPQRGFICRRFDRAFFWIHRWSRWRLCSHDWVRLLWSGGETEEAEALLRGTLEVGVNISDVPLILSVLGEWAKMLAACGDRTQTPGLFAHKSSQADTRAEATSAFEHMAAKLCPGDLEGAAARRRKRVVGEVVEDVLREQSQER